MILVIILIIILGNIIECEGITHSKNLIWLKRRKKKKEWLG
jgi:hypothetical protein